MFNNLWEILVIPKSVVLYYCNTSNISCLNSSNAHYMCGFLATMVLHYGITYFEVLKFLSIRFLDFIEFRLSMSCIQNK